MAARQTSTTAKKKPQVRIKTKHPDILRLPAGKKFWQVPLRHYENLVKRKGYAPVIKALTNLETWNRRTEPIIAKRASDIADRLRRKLRPELAKRPHKTPKVPAGSNKKSVRRNQTPVAERIRAEHPEIAGLVANATKRDGNWHLTFTTTDTYTGPEYWKERRARFRTKADADRFLAAWRINANDAWMRLVEEVPHEEVVLGMLPPDVRKKASAAAIGDDECLVHIKGYTVQPHPRKCPGWRTEPNPRRRSQLSRLTSWLKRRLGPKTWKKLYKEFIQSDPEIRKAKGAEKKKLIEEKVRRYAVDSNPAPDVHIKNLEGFWGGKRARVGQPMRVPQLEPGDKIAKVGDLLFVGYLSPRDGTPTVYVHGMDNGFERNDDFLRALQEITSRMPRSKIHGPGLYVLPDNRTFQFQARKFTDRGIEG